MKEGFLDDLIAGCFQHRPLQNFFSPEHMLKTLFVQWKNLDVIFNQNPRRKLNVCHQEHLRVTKSLCYLKCEFLQTFVGQMAELFFSTARPCRETKCN